MTAAGGLPPAVLQSRKRFEGGRLKLRAQHDRGSPGIQVCVRLADLVDSIMLDLFEAAVQQIGPERLAGQIAIVAHGGYGRRDMAPYSDVDLMLLHTPSSTNDASGLAKILSQWIVDSGCELGFSLRTPSQALRLAFDAT